MDDNNRRFGSIIRVPRARPNSLTWPKLWPRNARDKRSKFLLSSVVVRRILSGFRHVVDASSIPPPPSSPLSYLLASLVNYYVPSSSIHHRVFETVYLERRPNLFTPVIFTPNCNFATIVQLLNRYLGLLSFALSAITFDHIESTTLLLSYHFNYTYFNKFLIKNLYRI